MAPNHFAVDLMLRSDRCMLRSWGAGAKQAQVLDSLLGSCLLPIFALDRKLLQLHTKVSRRSEVDSFFVHACTYSSCSDVPACVRPPHIGQAYRCGDMPRRKGVNLAKYGVYTQQLDGPSLPDLFVVCCWLGPRLPQRF